MCHHTKFLSPATKYLVCNSSCHRQLTGRAAVLRVLASPGVWNGPGLSRATVTDGISRNSGVMRVRHTCMLCAYFVT